MWTEHSLEMQKMKWLFREEQGDPNYTPGVDSMNLDQEIALKVYISISLQTGQFFFEIICFLGYSNMVDFLGSQILGVERSSE